MRGVLPAAVRDTSATFTAVGGRAQPSRNVAGRGSPLSNLTISSNSGLHCVRTLLVYHELMNEKDEMLRSDSMLLREELRRLGDVFLN